jgi:alkylated DNA repair protein (DNA oxidative demethylase)
LRGRRRHLVVVIERDGLRYYPGRLDRGAQTALVDAVLAAACEAPFYTPHVPSGAAMSVQQTSLGSLGWITDRAGYRYEPLHPQTGRPWPPLPPALAALWDEVARWPAAAEACLVNLYRGSARMGLHVDADEAAEDAPVVSVSLGDDALFRIGGARRRDPTRSLRLRSGDVVVLAGASRRAYHGVDRIYPGTSRLIEGGGRINLTLRRVNR